MGRVFWPGMSKDVVRYIQGCLQCARNGSRKPASPSQPVTVRQPFEVLGIDHVGPFPQTSQGFKHVLVMVDYFSRFTWLTPTRTTGATEVLGAIHQWLRQSMVRPVAFYSDAGTGLTSRELRDGLAKLEILLAEAPSKSHKSVGMVEVTNKVMQAVLGKITPNRQTWDLRLPEVMRAVNERYMYAVGYSPQQILFGMEPKGPLEEAHPDERSQALTSAIRAGQPWWAPDDSELKAHIMEHVAKVEGVRQDVWIVREEEIKLRQAARCSGPLALTAGDMVMLAQEGKSPKLRPKWRGPFRVVQQVGRSSYRLENLDGTPMSGPRDYDYHEDHLKPFRPRKAWLSRPDEYDFPDRQNVRRERQVMGGANQLSPQADF